LKRSILSLALCAGAAVAASCGRASDAPVDQKKTTIAVIPKGTTHVFWQSIHAGAAKAGQELGVEIIWRGPLREDDRSAQIKEVEGFITRGVSGIVLAPLDDVALATPVADAARNKIPTVVIDSGLKSDQYVSFVATDNLQGGRLAGEGLAAALPKGGKVVMVRYLEGSASTTERETGFLDALKDHPNLEVVSSNQYGGAVVEDAYAKSEAILTRFKRADGSLGIDGIFCPNESTAVAMLSVLQANGWAGKVRFIGFDASEKLVNGLRDGAIDGLVLQDPVKMGYLGVTTMVKHLKGEPVDKRIDTGVRLVTHADIDKPEAQELLHPDLGKWLKP
jgi:ribose transport system substrate-binding protein